MKDQVRVKLVYINHTKVLSFTSLELANSHIAKESSKVLEYKILEF